MLRSTEKRVLQGYLNLPDHTHFRLDEFPQFVEGLWRFLAPLVGAQVRGLVRHTRARRRYR